MIKPMLCKSIKPDELNYYENKGYVAEPKLDGTRALMHIDFRNEELRITGRNGSDYTKSLPEFSIEKLRGYIEDTESIILDGELMAKDFSSTASRIHTSNNRRAKLLSVLNPVKFHAFDILYLDGKDLMGEPLFMRRKILVDRVAVGDLISIVKQASEEFLKLFESAIEIKGCEGLVLKHIESKYYENDRNEWLKCKATETIDLEIIGYDRGKHGNELVLETPRGRVFVAKPLRQKEFFEQKPRIVEVEYGELSAKGVMRFPIFKRFRYDKCKT